MTFTAAVASALSKYAVFRGRAPRSEFWWFWLFCLIAEMAALFVTGTMLSGSVASGAATSSMQDWFVFVSTGWLPSLVHLALILPSLAVAVRRLHDVGRSGWWLLLMFVPLGIFVLLFWWVQPSEPRPNEHGLPPF